MIFMTTVFDKFKYTDKKNQYGEYELRSTDTKRYRMTKEIYNFRGQLYIKFQVISYKRIKGGLARDFTSMEEVIVEKPRLQSQLKDAIQSAKNQAVYSHYAKKGERWKIEGENYGRIKNEIININLIDYIVYYNKGYNPKTKKSFAKFNKRKQGDKKMIDISLYDEKQKKYNPYSSSEILPTSEYEAELSEFKIAPERNYKLY